MDVANAPNGGGLVERNGKRGSIPIPHHHRHQQQQEEEVTESEEAAPEGGGGEGPGDGAAEQKNSVVHQNDLPAASAAAASPAEKISDNNKSKEVEELADIAKALGKIKAQNTVTHALLGAVIVLTAVWQVNEVSFLLWVQRKLRNPFKSLGDLIRGSLAGLNNNKGGRGPPVIESSPLPPVGVPDVTRADLPTLVISGDHR